VVDEYLFQLIFVRYSIMFIFVR